MIDKARKSHACHLNYDGVAMNNDVTSILQAIEQGDPLAAELLLPLVYNELRELATRKLAQEKPGQTLQATALVHDAYIRLVDTGKVEHWNSRGHFFAAAAEAMRRIVFDRARDKRRLKRGGGGQRVEIDLGEIPDQAQTSIFSHSTRLWSSSSVTILSARAS